MVLSKILSLFSSGVNVKNPPINLCFKGGGVKGCAYVGVYKALEENYLVNNIENIIGSSAGAIFACAVALKVPSEKLEEIILNTDFTKFKDESWGYAGKEYRMVEYYGYYNGDYFFNWFSDLLQQLVGEIDITFEKVYEKFKVNLIITASDITEGKIVYFSKDTTPEMELRMAVRCSMSIPFFFIPVQIIDQNEKVHYYIDGGCMNNYPLDYFSETNEETWGFNLLDDTFNLNPINNIIDFTTNIILTEINEINKLHYSKIPPKIENLKTINIPTLDLKATDFDISKEKIQELINIGYKETITHCLKNR